MLFTLSSVLASLKKFREEAFECPICLEPCTDTLVNPECNHRFCGKCIKESLHKCNHECPTCRVPIPTYRTCRRDPQFDHIVSTVLRRNDIQYVVVCIYHHDVTSCSLQSITNGDLLSTPCYKRWERKFTLLPEALGWVLLSKWSINCLLEYIL